MKSKKFKLLERTFILKPLVIGQVHQLQKKCGINMSKISAGEEGVQSMLSDVSKVAMFIAVIVHEEGVTLQEKKLDPLAEFFLWNTDMNTMKGIMADFFDVMNSQGSDTSNSKAAEESPDATTPAS